MSYNKKYNTRKPKGKATHTKKKTTTTKSELNERPSDTIIANIAEKRFRTFIAYR